MRNLRKFNTEEDYNAAELNYPAVSWITGNDSFHYDKTEPTPPEPTYGGLTVKYYIEDPSVEVTLFNGGGASSSSSGSGSGSGSGGGAMPTTMIVDGVEETPINTWRFETSGEHIVQYAFENNEIPTQYFTSIHNITSVVVGDDITSIGAVAFRGDSSITSATIGSGITSIGASAFQFCSGLTSITSLATTPPYLDGGNAFSSTNDCPIYVPASAVDTYQASTSTGWSEYASRIEAIR